MAVYEAWCGRGLQSIILEMPTDSCHFPCTSDTHVRPQNSLTRKALSATRGLARGGVRHSPVLDAQIAKSQSQRVQIAIKSSPGPPADMCRVFLLYKSRRIFSGTLSHKMREKIRRQNPRKKFGGSKIKIRERSVLPKTDPKNTARFDRRALHKIAAESPLNLLKSSVENRNCNRSDFKSLAGWICNR